MQCMMAPAYYISTFYLNNFPCQQFHSDYFLAKFPHLIRFRFQPGGLRAYNFIVLTIRRFRITQLTRAAAFGCCFVIYRAQNVPCVLRIQAGSASFQVEDFRILQKEIPELGFSDDLQVSFPLSRENRHWRRDIPLYTAATGYSKFSWNFQSPDGKTYTVQDFRTMFPYARVEGDDTTTLTVKNVSTAMNGWAVYCAFVSDNTEVDTTLAFLYVNVYNPTTDSAPKSYTATYYTYTLLYSADYGYYYYIPNYDDDDVVLYVDEYGTFTPAHPDADDYDDFLYEDDFGYFMPAHPDAY